MNKKHLLYLALIALIGILQIVHSSQTAPKATVAVADKPVPIDINPDMYYHVTKVVDGDTFHLKVEETDITVRMLGINTPETVDPRKPAECYGKEASNEAKRILEHQVVRLSLNPKREVLDKYGRYLAYVYRDDGLFVNEYLVRNGFAKEYTYGKKYSEQENFRMDQTKAQVASLGLWGECPATTVK
jgi:micrococcal nuclease